MAKKKSLILCFLFQTLLFTVPNHAQNVDISTNQWQLSKKGGIIRQITPPNCKFRDDIEMSGRKISGIIDYSVDSLGQISLNRKIIWPQLRELPKSNSPSWHIYRAYTIQDFDDEIVPNIYHKDQLQVLPPVENLQINGFLRIVHKPMRNGLVCIRTLFPSMETGGFAETWRLKNTSDTSLILNITAPSFQQNLKGVNGIYRLKQYWTNQDNITLKSNEEYEFTGFFTDYEVNATDTAPLKIWTERQDFLTKMNKSLVLETPDAAINQLFHFSKIRGSESIFDSKLGLVHSPGGGRYYAGFWANDQAEYIGPFFPFLDYPRAQEATLNMYRLYLKQINPAYKNIRYSFETEGDAPINPLDRGDAAMIAYGALQYVLALSDEKIAKELLPLIDWCLEYCHRKLNSEGVVVSESDEMEGRIETGNANLATSSLYYGALDLYENLQTSLGKLPKEIAVFHQRKIKLAQAIDSYFGANIEGLKTYKYFKEHKQLRHWICLPLVMGIYDRKEGTMDALFNKLWSENGVHVEKNAENPKIAEIFWDRATLYTLRGTFLAGATEQSMVKLKDFSQERLLGKRVPYVVEAFPEGNMAHLSAESGLYCRVITEGVFGIKSEGLNKFSLTPRLPKVWDFMRLKNMAAFGGGIDINITKTAKGLRVLVHQKGKVKMDKIIAEGERVLIDLSK